LAKAKLISHELSDAHKDASGKDISEANAFMPYKNTCADDDIYDVVLVSGAAGTGAAAVVKKWEVFGYQPVKLEQVDAPSLQYFELNGQVDQKGKGITGRAEYAFLLEPKREGDSRALMVLTCKSLKSVLKTRKDNPSPTANDVKMYDYLAKLQARIDISTAPSSSSSSSSSSSLLSRKHARARHCRQLSSSPPLSVAALQAQLPISDLRVVSRTRSDDRLAREAGSEEASLIDSGLTPLFFAGEPGSAVHNAGAKFPWVLLRRAPSERARLCGMQLTHAVPPTHPTRRSEPASEEVRNADIRQGRTENKLAMFIYVARGGATVLTKIQAHPFTDARKNSRKKDPTPIEAPPGAVLPPGLADKIKTLSQENELQAGDKASIAIISKESTYQTITAKLTFTVKDLGAPSTCRVTTTPTWAKFDCPITKGKVSCDNTPDANYVSKTAYLGHLITMRDGDPPPELNTEEGMVVHNFKTVDCLDNWERVVPSPYDDEPDLVNDARLATMPYLWLRRRFSGGVLEAKDQLRCLPLAQDKALKPVDAVRLITRDDEQCYKPRAKPHTKQEPRTKPKRTTIPQLPRPGP
jgi:hypothetical protein